MVQEQTITSAFKKGEVIFCEWEVSSDVYILKTGQVQINKFFADREKTLDILSPGAIFGEMALLDNAPRSASAIAYTDCTLLKFNRANFERLASVKPAIAIKLLQILATRIEDQRNKFNILRLPDTESKIMAVFLMQTKKMALDIHHISDISFKIESEDIASWAGIKIEDCKITLENMIRSQKLLKTGKKFIVKNIYQFKRHIQSKQQRQK